MAGVIILVYGEGRHLVPRPADYHTLVDVAHAKFPKLDDFANDSITFHFTPEWFDGEVELDRNAFAEVQDRTVLRVNAVAVSPHRCYDFKIQNEAVSATLSYEILPPGWVRLWFIYVPTGRKVSYAFRPPQRFRRLMAHMATVLGFDLDRTGFYYGDEVLETYDTPEEMFIAHDDLIEVHALTLSSALEPRRIAKVSEKEA